MVFSDPTPTRLLFPLSPRPPGLHGIHQILQLRLLCPLLVVFPGSPAHGAYGILRAMLFKGGVLALRVFMRSRLSGPLFRECKSWLILRDPEPGLERAFDGVFRKAVFELILRI